MAKNEINIFGTSFLDLLSGALAAVIILFVIVPKMSSDQQNTLEELEQLDVQVSDLRNIMEQIQNSVPQDIYDQVEQRLEELQSTISSLTEQVNTLQERLSESRNENEELQRRIEQLEEENQRLVNQNGQRISEGKVFGIDAELGVVCIWPENADVDLHVTDLSSGKVCYYRNRTTSFGCLNMDIMERPSEEDDRYELFYQEHIVPGRYKISFKLFSLNNMQSANVDGFAVLFPGKANQVKIPFEHIILTREGQTVDVGTLVVTTDNITLQ